MRNASTHEDGKTKFGIKKPKTNKILAQIIVDDFETDEALKNISLADIKSDDSDNFVKDIEPTK